MQQHTGAWQGVTYWAGGPWWGNYMFSIEPQNGVDKPQMGILLQHLSAPSGDYNGTPGPDYISATGNLLQAFGNDGNDQLYFIGNQNQLSGGNGDDALSANGANNSLFGEAGNDSLSASGGPNQLFGGAGNDAYFVDNAGDTVTENGGEGSDTVYARTHFRLSANVEYLILQGSADLQGAGNSLSNAIHGNTGSNLLDGDAGADGMFGGAGNDVYFVDNAGDAVVEGASEGNDVVFSTAHLRLSANVEHLVLQGSANLQGGGNSLSNVMYGNTGSNLLDGDAGADGMLGGPGTTSISSTMPAMPWSRTPAKAPTRCFQPPIWHCRRTWKPWCCKAAATYRATATAKRTRSTATPATICSTAGPVPISWSAAPATTSTSSTMPST